VAAKEGVASFTGLKIDTPGYGFVLQFSVNSVTIVSDSFTVYPSTQIASDCTVLDAGGACCMLPSVVDDCGVCNGTNSCSVQVRVSPPRAT
jgi:hypothetical protein